MHWILPDSYRGLGRASSTSFLHHCLNDIHGFLCSCNLNLRDKDGATPLHLAVHSNSVQIVSLLLSKHVSTNVKDNQGKTALQLCLHLVGPEGICVFSHMFVCVCVFVHMIVFVCLHIFLFCFHLYLCVCSHVYVFAGSQRVRETN